MSQLFSAAVAPSPVRLLPRARQGMSLEQEKLAARIERHIRRETNDKIRELRVEIVADDIVLSGRCGTFYTKQLAQHAAMSLAEESHLLNRIEVW